MAFGDFTHQASAYAQSRPTYPPQLLDLLIREFCPVLFTPKGATVADLGAGTGIFTQCLWERGFLVWAVEPNDAMRENALSGPAHWVKGTFESTTLPKRGRWIGWSRRNRFTGPIPPRPFQKSTGS